MKFYDTIDHRSNFVIGVGNNPMNQFGTFAKGFAHAAATLAEDLLAREHGFRNYDAYPVVFLYRHSLELYLKNLLYKPALLFAFKGIEEFESKLGNHHNLSDLSERAAKILRRLFPHDRELEQVTQRETSAFRLSLPKSILVHIRIAIRLICKATAPQPQIRS